MFQDMTSLVVDIGTARARIGYGGDDAPLLMPHSLLSTSAEAMRDADRPRYSIGDKHLAADRPDNEIASIFAKRGADGYQYDYERLEAFLEHQLTGELGVEVKDYSVLLSEDVAAKPQENREIREKVSEFLFERLNAANVFFMKAPVLACFATGRSSALVVDSGENFTRSVAVHEGFCLNKSARVVPYGGRHLSLELERFLAGKLGRRLANRYALSGATYAPSFLDFHQLQLLADIKEALSVRRPEEPAEAQTSAVEYELPDRNVLTIDRKELREGFLWGEEGAGGGGFKGAAALATETVNSCDVDVKKELYSNLLLSGGNMLYGSFIEELVGRIGEAAPANVKVKPVSVCWPTERKYLGWIGGSIVTSLSSFQSYWVGNQEWRENGPTILDKKCT